MLATDHSEQIKINTELCIVGKINIQFSQNHIFCTHKTSEATSENTDINTIGTPCLKFNKISGVPFPLDVQCFYYSKLPCGNNLLLTT